MSDLPVHFSTEGRERLGIPAGTLLRKFLIGRMKSIKTLEGYIFRGESVEPWRVEELEGDNPCYFIGPAFKGRTLDQLLEKPCKNWISILGKVIRAYSYMRDKLGRDFRLYTTSILVNDKEDLLILPPPLMDEIIGCSNETVKRLRQSRINHPYKEFEHNVSHILGVLVYTWVSGSFPFSGETVEAVNEEIRTRRLVPLHLKVPGVRKEVSRFLTRAFESEDPIPLDEWSRVVEEWQIRGIREPLEAEKQKALETEARVLEIRYRKKQSRELFWERNWKKVAAISGGGLFILIILFTSLYNLYWRPRVTRDLSPREVVETYYHSISTIDFATLQDCIIGNAGKVALDEVMNLHVLSKQGGPMDFGSPFVETQDWLSEGKYPLGPGITLYGVGELEIFQEKESPEPVFLASYEKWYSEPEDNGINRVLETIYIGAFYRERLTLKMDRGGWVIYHIETLEEKALSWEPGDEFGEE